MLAGWRGRIRHAGYRPGHLLSRSNQATGTVPVWYDSSRDRRHHRGGRVSTGGSCHLSWESGGVGYQPGV